MKTESVDEELAEVVQKSIEGLQRQKDDARKKLKDFEVEIATKIKQLRAKCPHPKWTYVPDASGNNDSYYFCNYCHLEK